ncbi:hypothetical protein [Escherichia coli]|uniref:hypothetical protein n=1 Tax=Escherichia coli TaxID=562 RepID=UPI00344B7E86
MSRAELLRDIEAIISGAGFELSNSEAPMTFKKNVSYPGLIAGKNEIAHFLLFTNTGTVQITAKWQEVSGVTNGAIVIHTQRLKSDPGGNLLS